MLFALSTFKTITTLFENVCIIVLVIFDNSISMKFKVFETASDFLKSFKE